MKRPRPQLQPVGTTYPESPVRPLIRELVKKKERRAPGPVEPNPKTIH